MKLINVSLLHLHQLCCNELYQDLESNINKKSYVHADKMAGKWRINVHKVVILQELESVGTFLSGSAIEHSHDNVQKDHSHYGEGDEGKMLWRDVINISQNINLILFTCVTLNFTLFKGDTDGKCKS
ncbi:hypothetical protein AMELA_G00016720 [Ameiurus melas]|uniref:Uncharacterized protein n=1 Tax=Ameiurus melas TaxID=219545 RepID=A0A7J6BC66_AMEME|nr:hypothetical protein AMELA_G00016720 [Ameiurus melas]